MSTKKYTSAWLLGLLLCCVTISLVACGEGSGEKGTPRRRQRSLLVPVSSGNPYEIMVVAEDSLWDSYAGAALQHVLNTPIPMLPQEESYFHVSRVANKHYDRITKLFRNIIKLEISPNYSQSKMIYERDVFSSPQMILTIKGPNMVDLSVFITDNKKQILRFFSVEEINREAIRLEGSHNIKFDKKVEEMFGCRLFIPVDLKKMKVGKDFIWASDDGISSIQNVCIYSYPYVSEKVFTRHAFIALRDTFMRRNISGVSEGSFMSTNEEFVEVSNMQIMGHYVQEARGLWELEKEPMGGPFVSHSQVDTINGRVIVVEAFVYAPDKKKRTMLRRLEAALYTLQLPAKEE